MSVKPILFNTDMVQAILDGRKTVTRRVLAEKVLLEKKWGLDREPYLHHGKWYYDEQTAVDDSRTIELKPKYQPGDILYVRETWQKTYINDGTTHPTNFRYEYKASDEQRTVYRWLPSIHMPKEAARIWLKVTNVRVERLLRMSHEAAKQEGIHYCESPDGFTWKVDSDMNCCYVTPSGAFEALWNGTVNKDDMDRYGWEANPWVWVIEFEQCKKPEEVVL